jgi:prepilin-type N-terminal cleavage/methylation domain-containing protein
MRVRGNRGQRGYTLIEALVAVAIIGMISLVAVPNFMSYYRAGRIKASLRQLTTDIRAARQVAVSEQGCSMISFAAGAESNRTYEIYGARYVAGQCTDWALRDTKTMQESVFFRASTFDDWVDFPSGSGTKDIIFRANGATVTNPTAMYSATIQTSFNVPKNHYQIDVFPSGQLRVVEP